MAKLDLNVLDKKVASDQFQVIEFKGEMDKSNNVDVRTALTNFIESFPDKHLFFDLTYFDFVNSEGVGMLVAMYYKLKELGKDLVIISPQPRVLDVFNIIGLPKIVPIAQDLNDALTKVSNV